MFLKAMLVCDDVRVEVGGTVTLVGVYNERVYAPPGDGPIQLPRLSFVAIVGGLRGKERLGFRQRLRDVRAPEGPAGPLVAERHDPGSDEHNFVFGNAPMVFPGPGTYEVVLDVDAGGEQATYRCRLELARAPVSS